jgi:glutamate--cysteine ligase
VGRVGIELEAHCVDLDDPYRRPGWQEICDVIGSLPDALWPALTFMLVTQLDDPDPDAADIAAQAIESVANAWDRAARVGLADRRLYASAVACVHAAAERVPAELHESMQQLVRMVEQGSCPGDAFAERVIRYGVAAAVTQLAQGEG